MPTPLKKITLTITNDLLLHILAHFAPRTTLSDPSRS
jgi:hypothetical protein